MSISVSRDETGEGKKPYVITQDGNPVLDRGGRPRRFSSLPLAWNAASRIKPKPKPKPAPQEAAQAQIPASTRPYGCIDPNDRLTHADLKRIGVKYNPVTGLPPEEVEAAYAARAEARAHAEQPQATPQDGPGAELRRQAAELRCSAGYADDYRAYRADLDAAEKLEARARQLEMQAAATAPTEPDPDTGAQPMTPNTAPAPLDTVPTEPAQAPAPAGMTFAQSEQLAALQLAAHIDEIETYEGFELFIRGYFTQGTYNLLKYTNTLRTLWDARHPQRPQPAPQAPTAAAPEDSGEMAGIRKALNIIKRGDPTPEAPVDEAKADPAPAHSKARWHEGFADGDAGRGPVHEVADYRSGWNHGAVCRAQREAAEGRARLGLSDPDAGGEPEAPADGEKDAPEDSSAAPVGEPAQDSGMEAIETETGAGAPAPALPTYGALLAEYHLLARAVAQLSDRLAAAESIIEALRGQAPARPAAPPAPKPATPRATVTDEDSAPYKRGFAAAQKGGKADAEWFKGYGLGTADKAEGRASREAEMAGRSIRSGYVAGFTGANETTNARWVAGYEAGLRG
ncbi:hypothetical protein SAMN02949497_3451 [Methylomagnum ishizawai]|uniref:Uncharacterized protein n=1 Tax=Methylomagnum ishizawai TaxID=1760988 RepID=A0A1Y6D0W4_9GAMM|nr:hypothetical protein [Methylomagnum ishizawai]SMF96070.1 hypothetical protein SAMN02949497_3451 [Methylomagnum ishizawai]